MTREESLTIVEMIISGWPDAKPLDRDEIAMYARSIQDLDAELATHAVLKAHKESRFRPGPPELRERVRAERRSLAAELPPIEPTTGRPLPMWVKRWICARLLYKRFGKEQDLRRFPEQGDFGDLTQEVMPEGVWTEEAESVGEKEFHDAFRRMF
jgi:hypothetical protein